MYDDDEKPIRSIDIDHARDAVADAKTTLRQHVLSWMAVWLVGVVGLAVSALGIWLSITVHDAWVITTIFVGAPLVLLSGAVIWDWLDDMPSRTASSHPRQAVTLAERKLRDTQNRWDGSI